MAHHKPTEAEIDLEVEAIMAMSSEELDAYLRAEGLDPDELAESSKRAMERAIADYEKSKCVGGRQ